MDRAVGWVSDSPFHPSKTAWPQAAVADKNDLVCPSQEEKASRQRSATAVSHDREQLPQPGLPFASL